MENENFKIDDIYVPVKRRKTLDVDVVNTLAEDILENGQQSPILVRSDGKRLVLIEGLHRLEACRSLGEETIVGLLVQARRH
jgi:ParB-like chromosome segregation protein Spo0J